MYTQCHGTVAVCNKPPQYTSPRTSWDANVPLVCILQEHSFFFFSRMSTAAGIKCLSMLPPKTLHPKAKIVATHTKTTCIVTKIESLSPFMQHELQQLFLKVTHTAVCFARLLSISCLTEQQSALFEYADSTAHSSMQGQGR